MNEKSFARLSSVFGWLTGLYPSAFRRRFARDMTETFGRECRRSFYRGGHWGVVRLAVRSFSGVVMGAVVEWCEGVFAGARRQSARARRPRARGGIVFAFFQDVRYGTRTLLKSPGFAALAITTLALGIALNTTIFSLINTVLFAELPIAEPQRFVFVWASNEKAGEPRSLLTLPEAAELRSAARSFEEISVAQQDSFILTGGEAPSRVRAFRTTDNFFDVWGIPTVLGRGFHPGEDRPGAEPVCLLSHGFWNRRFGSDPSVIGSTLMLDGESFTVVGVLSPRIEFGDLSDIDVWVPLDRELATASRDERIGFTQALLREGTSLDEAQREMDILATRLEQEFDATNRDWRFEVRSVSDELFSEEDRALLWLVVVSVSFVLLLACANVANMLMARATSRSKEVALRLAVGASRLRLLRQLFTEGLLMAVAAGALGLVLARGFLDLLVLITSESHWLYRSAAIDERVLLFTLGVSLATPFVFGLVPSLRASRPNLSEALKEGGRSGMARSGLRARGALVMVQVALALVLMVVTGLLVRSVIALRQVELGFEPEGVLTVELELPVSKYESDDAVRFFYDEMLTRASETAGVQAAALVSPRPLAFSGLRRSFRLEGETPPPDVEGPTAYISTASESYLEALRIPLLHGRSFSATDHAHAETVALVSATAVARYWPDGAPIGQRIRLSDDPAGDAGIEIVGVVGDVIHVAGVDPENVPQIYLPFAQRPTREATLVVRGARPAMLVEPMREHIRELDPDQSVAEMRTMNEIMGELLASSNAIIALFVIFAGFAMTMASLGIYGVMSYAVSQREHEIGIRMTLGASARNVSAMVVRQGAKLVTIGAAFGLAGALVLSRFLVGLLYGVSASDPVTFVAVPLLLVVVAALANYLPARRAMRIDPVTTLRAE